MKIGLQIPDHTWGNSQALSPTLLRIARVAEEAGFELIGVPDHLWQVPPWVGRLLQEEARGLGIGLPPVAERFERLQEAVQICLRMWAGDHGDDQPFEVRRVSDA